MDFKHKRMEPERQIAFTFIAMAACVLVLTAITIWFSNSGIIKQEEHAVVATVELKQYAYGQEYSDSLLLTVTAKNDGIADLRELEATVKDLILREYMSSITWDAIFTYRLDDGTTQERKYRKSGQNKVVDAFLQKHYKKMEETTDNYYYSEFLERQ